MASLTPAFSRIVGVLTPTFLECLVRDVACPLVSGQMSGRNWALPSDSLGVDHIGSCGGPRMRRVALANRTSNTSSTMCRTPSNTPPIESIATWVNARAVGQSRSASTSGGRLERAGLLSQVLGRHLPDAHPRQRVAHVDPGASIGQSAHLASPPLPPLRRALARELPKSNQFASRTKGNNPGCRTAPASISYRARLHHGAAGVVARTGRSSAIHGWAYGP